MMAHIDDRRIQTVLHRLESIRPADTHLPCRQVPATVTQTQRAVAILHRRIALDRTDRLECPVGVPRNVRLHRHVDGERKDSRVEEYFLRLESVAINRLVKKLSCQSNQLLNRMRPARTSRLILTHQKTHKTEIPPLLERHHPVSGINLDRVHQRRFNRLACVIPLLKTRDQYIIVAAVDADGHTLAPFTHKPHILSHQTNRLSTVVLTKGIDINSNIPRPLIGLAFDKPPYIVKSLTWRTVRSRAGSSQIPHHLARLTDRGMDRLTNRYQSLAHSIILSNHKPLSTFAPWCSIQIPNGYPPFSHSLRSTPLKSPTAIRLFPIPLSLKSQPYWPFYHYYLLSKNAPMWPTSAQKCVKMRKSAHFGLGFSRIFASVRAIWPQHAHIIETPSRFNTEYYTFFCTNPGTAVRLL